MNNEGCIIKVDSSCGLFEEWVNELMAKQYPELPTIVTVLEKEYYARVEKDRHGVLTVVLRPVKAIELGPVALELDHGFEKSESERKHVEGFAEREAFGSAFFAFGE